jgi:putative ABC transport system permease protein
MEWLRKLGAWFRRPDDELAEELETHRALAEDDLRRSGLSAAAAAAESRRRMGNMLLAREDSRDVWLIRWIDRLGQHLRYGVRGLSREPAFALTALLTLGLGTAATTTVFSVVDAELWRPLPYPAPERLFAIGSRDPSTHDLDGISLDELQAWRERATGFESLAARGSMGRRTAQLGHAESFVTTEVTTGFFTTLGRTALLGRLFSSDTGGHVAVLTERGWTRIFAGDPSVVGRSLMLDDRPVTIIGIVKTDDSSGPEGELYVPIDERTPAGQGATLRTIYGRLAPGTTPAAAVHQLQAAIDERATVDPTRRHHKAFAEDVSSYYRTSNARPLYFFLGASLLVLVLTIANVASLIVARAVRRIPEFAVRSAIGGGTGTLAAQLTAEGALVAVPGCALGFLLAYAATRVLGQFVPDDFLYRGTQIVVDGRVVIATCVVAMATTAGLAIIPLGIIRRIGERAALGAGYRTSDSPLAARSRRVLLIGQLALTVTLVAGAGVFVQSFVALTQVPLGFDPANAWSIRIAMAGPRFAADDSIRTYIDDVVERVRGVPGVQQVAAATSSPLRSGWLALVTPSPADASAPTPVRAIVRAVGAGYFPVTGTRIVRGRGITSDDSPGAPAAAVVNEELVRRIFGTEDPIGRSIEFAGRGAVGRGTVTIVGVASDTKEIRLNEVAMPDLYVSFAQRPNASVELLVRGRGQDRLMLEALREAAVDPLVPVTGVSTLQSRVDGALQNERFHLIVVAAFALLAVLTASIGVYGAMAYAVTARWREFGVRLALGASPLALVIATIWQSVRLALAGGIAGLGVALLAARWIGDALYLVPGSHNGLLYNTRTTDPAALAGALIVMLLLALAAGAIPARRASRIDPVQALRAD